ncbi:YbhB/YbcL family Raf kinase inhibitor-like protein [Clostridium sp. 19966]|uniref:YbhB/YbcL family Raf kinase inhibitor-like protein n=1 Tax=Clostridium sp. 19966 TaxID=2768166 RepID=UPI0028E07057|nr:YbhB/YbcL family Raf kinase inhibitor-like protein [Clostridium sp. 19966]MDT8716839.1 YbhB/YbcL family Raf kinase inhibitor-like protein [Clostridium sp. 19966]
MKITSSGIINGVIEDKYGKRGNKFNSADIPTYSLPIKIENQPEGTVSFAILLEDRDAVPVCGFSWIHWTAANILESELEENASVTKKNFVQGVNSWYSPLGETSKELSMGYGGMAPPDAPHVYELHVYALDTKLNLEEGFYMNEMFRAMESHILDQATIKGTYSN